MFFSCSTKICHKVAFNDIRNKQRILKVNNKTTKNYCKDLLKVKKTQNNMTDIIVVSLLSNLNWSHRMLLLYTLKRHLCAELTLN